MERTCKVCGTKGLHWEKIAEGIRLFTKAGKRHICKSKE